MTTDSQFGSATWLDAIKASNWMPPPLGKGRPTERLSPHCRALGRTVEVEGGYQLTLLLLLDIWQAAGLVEWFRERPFRLTTVEHGLALAPSFIFEWIPTGAIYVVSFRQKKFQTTELVAEAQEAAKFLDDRGLRYLLWNDKEHVTTTAWHNVRQIHRSGVFAHDTPVLERAIACVPEGGTTLGSLAKSGIDSEIVLNLIWNGVLHINLLEKRNVSTRVVSAVDPHVYGALIGSRPDPESWWNALQDY